MKASVVIPVYNGEKYIEDTLTSLLEQDYQDKEIIIVDDGSTDGTADVVAALVAKYPIIRYERIDNSGGPAKPRNIGLNLAQGEVVFLFDADDIALPGKLSSAMAVFKLEPSVGMLSTNFSMVDASAEKTVRYRMIDDYYTLQGVLGRKIFDAAYFIESSDAFSAIIKTNFIGTSSVAIRKSLLVKIGGFDETLRHIDDREMWFRAVYATNLAYIETPCHLYRNHPDGISHKRSVLQAEERIIAAKKLVKLPKSKQAVKNLDQFISINYYALGIHFLGEGGAGVMAFRSFVLSLKYKLNINSIKGIAKVVLGRRA